MAEVKGDEIKYFEVKYQCDTCGSFDVQYDGIKLLSSPPKYPHTCKSCKTHVNLKSIYPGVKAYNVSSD